MLANRVVEHLNVIEHALLGFLARFVCPTPDALALERREEALGDGVVMAVTASARRGLKIVSPYERGAAHAGELRALIREDQHPLLRFAPPCAEKRGSDKTSTVVAGLRMSGMIAPIVRDGPIKGNSSRVSM